MKLEHTKEEKASEVLGIRAFWRGSEGLVVRCPLQRSGIERVDGREPWTSSLLPPHPVGYYIEEDPPAPDCWSLVEIHTGAPGLGSAGGRDAHGLVMLEDPLIMEEISWTGPGALQS
ncbi:hypothetical protein NDU88_002433 [Pleurodeles waltl]|uniref:Uncharacterized protein n=1 Tax=Pleurodeles waltl TaxID=8319 RepID=A0AAV7TLM6_PLEWA|nr:hypothetical protein NDU88_002433 [Pleurodeles waltl]